MLTLLNIRAASRGTTMRRSSPVGLGVTLLVLVTSASTVSAECAWVLWTQTTRQELPSTWSANGYPNHQACQARIDDVIKQANDSTSSFALGPNVFLKDKEGKVFMSFTYTCLPDTVDPRGPKAK